MKTSAGILLYRKTDNYIEVFLIHLGGPFWKGKEKGAWSIPKGEFAEGEDSLAAAKREFKEETGQTIDGDCGGSTLAAGPHQSSHDENDAKRND